jgi:D-sedoheptulose 7-phosphate isomerase
VKLAEAIKKAKRVYIIGNGGSYANAIHICNDLIGCGVKAHTLDPATLTAVANDFGYEHVFSRWLSVFGEPGDLLLALSGSGRSPNIVQAMKAADEIGMDIWPVFGDFGAPQAIFNEGKDMQSAERFQITLGHRVMKWLKSS